MDIASFPGMEEGEEKEHLVYTCLCMHLIAIEFFGDHVHTYTYILATNLVSRLLPLTTRSSPLYPTVYN